MARFEGATYLQRTVPLVEVESSKKGLISCWFRAANGEGGTLLVGGAGATEYIKLSLSPSTGFIDFVVKDSAGTTLWDVTTDDAYDDDDFHHLAISMDLGGSRGQVYVDTVAADLTANTALTDGTVAYASATEWVAIAGLAGATPFTGSGYDFAFWPGISIDLSDEDEIHRLVAIDSNRIKTDPSDLKPVGYGLEGRDLGAAAAMMFSSGFRKNVGAGGVFVLTGLVGEDQADEVAPSGYRFLPRWRTPGERWFASEQSGDPYPRSQTFIENREGLTSFGKRLGLEEMDAPTRRERPGFNFTDLVLGLDEEDDDEDFLR